MSCPICKNNSLCGCNSCKKRRKGKMVRYRAYKFIKGDFIKCPYCRSINHVDSYL